MGILVEISSGNNSFVLPNGWDNTVELVEIYDNGSCRVMHKDKSGCQSVGLLSDIKTDVSKFGVGILINL